MKASDLRIGNQMKLFLGIGDNGAEYRECEIQGIMIHHGAEFYLLKNGWVGISNKLKPIPLTEEWLLKFGFEKRGIYYHFPKHDIFKLEQYKLKNAYWLRYYTESIDCVRINSVHQLQNLYHALTGEELTHGK